MARTTALIAALVCAVTIACSAGSALAAQTPLGMLRATVGRLHVQAHQARTGSATRRAATGAGASLAAASVPALWLSGDQIVAPSYGTTVFANLVRALTRLQPASARKLAADEPAITSAAHDVAAAAIQQAGGTASPVLAQAGQQLAAGSHLAAAGQRIAAVRSDQQAWADAYAVLTQSVTGAATSVPAAPVDAAAANALGSKQIGLAGPQIMSNQPPLTLDGKPEMFFGGSEGCPFCAVERWGMIVALSRFGTFSNLSLMQSDPTDGPSVRTFTFLGSSYQSAYISFVPVEILSNVHRGFGFAPLQRPSAAQQALMRRYDPSGQVPFIDIGNALITVDSTVQPTLIQGMSWAHVLAALSDPSSVAAQAVGGEAEVLTAEVCEATGGNPSSVCSVPEVQQYEAALPSLNGKGGGCPAQPGAQARRRSALPPQAVAARCITK